MKFVISTVELNQMINKMQNVVSQKPATPILSNFLIEAFDDELILTATDLSVGIRCHMNAQILEEGATTLPAKTFANLIRELVAPTIQVSTNTQNITTLVSGTSRFKINGMAKNEYPELPELKDAQAFSIDQAILKDLLYRTSFAISRDDNRYILTGCHMQIANGTVIFVGTDGKRLNRTFAKIDLEQDINFQCVIPSKATEEILKNLVEDKEEKAKVFIMEDKIAIELNHTLLLAKLLTGEYPDVTRVIPEQADLKLTLHRNELITMLRQISLFRPDNNHSARFAFTEGELQVTANTSEVGEAHVAMPVNYHGAKLEVAFNPGYLLDILRHCKEETVTMGLIDSYNPGIIVDGEKLEKSLDATPLFIIMPMRLSED